MEKKKHRLMSRKPSPRQVRTRALTPAASQSNSPQLRSPATTAISAKSMHSVETSTLAKAAAEGGVSRKESSASTSAAVSTTSPRKKASIFCIPDASSLVTDRRTEARPHGKAPARAASGGEGGKDT